MHDQREPTTEQRFAARCRLVRESYGWAQTELAARLAQHGIKIDGSAITRLERGDRNIRLNEAAAIAKEFGLTGIDAMVRPAESHEDQLERARTELRDAEWRASWINGEYAAARARLDRLEREVRGEHVAPPPPTSWADVPEHWTERPEG